MLKTRGWAWNAELLATLLRCICAVCCQGCVHSYMGMQSQLTYNRVNQDLKTYVTGVVVRIGFLLGRSGCWVAAAAAAMVTVFLYCFVG